MIYRRSFEVYLSMSLCETKQKMTMTIDLIYESLLSH
jgi:hypothetical protein